MTVKILIEGDGLTFNKDITFKKAGQIITFLGSDESIAPVEQGQVVLPPAKMLPAEDQTPMDLILQSKAKTNAQKITVLGSYLSDKDRSEHFFVKDVQQELKKLGEEPTNFGRDLKSAETMKYIYQLEPKNEGRYGVTVAGRNAINTQFSGEMRNKTVSKKRSSGTKKSIPLRTEITSFSISSEMEGYPNFHKLPTKADSILWVLAYADNQNVDGLTPKEVEHLTEKLKMKIPQNNFSAHNKKNFTEGYVAQTNGVFKLQHKGMDHLKTLMKQEVNGKTE